MKSLPLKAMDSRSASAGTRLLRKSTRSWYLRHSKETSVTTLTWHNPIWLLKWIKMKVSKEGLTSWRAPTHFLVHKPCQTLMRNFLSKDRPVTSSTSQTPSRATKISQGTTPSTNTQIKTQRVDVHTFSNAKSVVSQLNNSLIWKPTYAHTSAFYPISARFARKDSRHRATVSCI